ncbi:type II toxin-antitoxin system Phd/YefM family antitoxin [Chloroflexi bacterium TSY]|nr:type II toxin-antitoxin system Phd/YefM family antitoxin [Chloroflexi bacterium TSY]
MQVSEQEVHNDTAYWLKRVSKSRECVFVTDDGEPQAVIIGMDAFRALLDWRTTSMLPSMSIEELSQQFAKALQDAGYHTEDDITNLVRDVKREIAAERTAAFEKMTDGQAA